ncbi:MAG: glucose-6-phosphate isomerase [Acidobacteria bacterium]|uniref:Glucose-6-phosphate isomerase n=1 Tax=Candidatus Polarisedimenticola svalbardensis TaxID=2886004 RepID=A0A8J7CKD4_9BACT|nr:glucose-6-phosphate isomerase [Candidatus Polarisedimenticola svalbardensis]
MTTLELWANYQAWLLDEPELGFRLDVSRAGMPSDYPDRMEAPMAAAFDAMEKLEEGEIANPDEGRMVGHYWLRDPGMAPDAAITEEILSTNEALRTFVDQVHKGTVKPPSRDRFENLLLCGIGGSALGPQFVASALGGTDDRIRTYFLDNTDPDGIDRILASIGKDLAATLTVVISKSGGTPETRNGMLESQAAYTAAGLEFGKHAVAITQAGSRLDRFAGEKRFLATFPMWDWVGGRTSVLSAVGLLPAALQGIDVDRMLEGAAAMDEVTRRRSMKANPAALLALCWFHAGDGRGLKDMVILPYKDRLAMFSRYLQQLVMESLGKEKDLDGQVVHQGLAVYGNKGSTDQHAYVQQLRDGVPNFFATFIEVMKDRDGAGIDVEDGVTSGDFLHGFLLGTRRALYENGRGSITLTVDQVGPFSVGMLIALYERAVGLYASLVNVNAYHQPGVEAGKKAAASVLDLQARLVAEMKGRGKAGGTCQDLAVSLGSPEEVETVFRILEHLAANPDRGVVRTPGESPFTATYRIK